MPIKYIKVLQIGAQTNTPCSLVCQVRVWTDRDTLLFILHINASKATWTQYQLSVLTCSVRTGLATIQSYVHSSHTHTQTEESGSESDFTEKLSSPA